MVIREKSPACDSRFWIASCISGVVLKLWRGILERPLPLRLQKKIRHKTNGFAISKKDPYEAGVIHGSQNGSN